MRSADDIADCMTAYFVEKSRTGTKKLLHVLDEGDQRAEGQRAGDDLAAAVPDDERRARSS